MQYLLLIYSDEKAMQTASPEQSGAIPRGIWRLHEGYGRRRREQGRPAAAPDRDRNHGPGQGRQDLRCSTGLTPRSRSSLAGISSSMRPILTPRSRGPRAARARSTARSKCGRSGSRDRFIVSEAEADCGRRTVRMAGAKPAMTRWS